MLVWRLIEGSKRSGVRAASLVGLAMVTMTAVAPSVVALGVDPPDVSGILPASPPIAQGATGMTCGVASGLAVVGGLVREACVDVAVPLVSGEAPSDLVPLVGSERAPAASRGASGAATAPGGASAAENEPAAATGSEAAEEVSLIDRFASGPSGWMIVAAILVLAAIVLLVGARKPKQDKADGAEKPVEREIAPAGARTQ